jgi:hypothetical protein
VGGMEPWREREEEREREVEDEEQIKRDMVH